MNKEELDRIKKAYSSGLKVQIWFNGHWKDFDSRDYSMYPEPFSENRQFRIVGSDYADVAEKRIAELEQKLEQAEKDLADYQFNYLTIKEVQKENAQLKKRNGELAGQKASLERWLGEAISVIKKFSEFLNSDIEYNPEHSQEHTDLWNELCERAERFLKEFTPPKV